MPLAGHYRHWINIGTYWPRLILVGRYATTQVECHVAGRWLAAVGHSYRAIDVTVTNINNAVAE